MESGIRPNSTVETGIAAAENAAEQRASLTISAEWLAYIGLALFALIMRVAALDQVQLTDYEAQQALHAWHTVNDNAPGSFPVAQSPLTHLTQLVAFSTLGATEFAARIGTALAGVALVLCPLLFRDTLGITRTFVWSVLLSTLTLPIVSARLADGTTWMMLFTVLSIWMIRRFWYSHSVSDAMWPSAFVTAMLLLSSPSGIPLFVILLAAGWLAVWRTALSAPQRLDLPGDDILQLSLKRLNSFPYARVIFVPFAVLFVTATAMMLNPGGLNTVGALLDAVVKSLTMSGAVDGLRMGLVALLTYEPLLIVFALGGSWLLWRHGAVSYIDRFAAAWAAISILALVVYPGTRPADAMWAVLPLSLLASYGITQLMVNRRVAALWSASESDGEEESHDIYTTRFWWVKWAISAGVLLLLLVASTHFLQVARALLDVPAGAGPADVLERLSVASYPRLAQGIGLLLTTGTAAVVLCLVCANLWGAGTSLQGIGLGFLWLLLLSGIGGAWNTAVAEANEPASLWMRPAITEDARLLRQTLFELADRESHGFPLLDLTIITDEEGILRDNGLIAWLLRDFPRARFVDDAIHAAGDPIVIVAEASDSPPELRGNYVGQRFVLRRHMPLAGLNLWQLPAWWSHRRLHANSKIEDAVILWLRQDVYDGR